jgi:sulfur transfer complex TusBCD TusB component (DsrH family)
MEMNKIIIYSVPEFVEVSYRADLQSVYLKWFSEYDEGNLVQDAVHAALDYVHQHNVRHWLADISTSPRGLSHKDQAWVCSEEFTSAISNSPLRKFALIPPLPETGQDVSWLSDWETNTLAKFGDHMTAKLSGDMDDIRLFFME